MVLCQSYSTWLSRSRCKLNIWVLLSSKWSLPLLFQCYNNFFFSSWKTMSRFGFPINFAFEYLLFHNKETFMKVSGCWSEKKSAFSQNESKWRRARNFICGFGRSTLLRKRNGRFFLQGGCIRRCQFGLVFFCLPIVTSLCHEPFISAPHSFVTSQFNLIGLCQTHMKSSS